MLVSSGYEGSINVWDIRSSTPLHTLAAHADKALAIAWQPVDAEAGAGAGAGRGKGGAGGKAALSQRFVSGGADNLVRFFKLPQMK